MSLAEPKQLRASFVPLGGRCRWPSRSRAAHRSCRCGNDVVGQAEAGPRIVRAAAGTMSLAKPKQDRASFVRCVNDVVGQAEAAPRVVRAAAGTMSLAKPCRSVLGRRARGVALS